MEYLDDIRIKNPGKYEGETEAIRYIHDVGEYDDSAACEGWFVGLFIVDSSEPEALRDPAYIINEGADGFVTGLGFTSVDEARKEFQRVTAVMEEEMGDG